MQASQRSNISQVSVNQAKSLRSNLSMKSVQSLKSATFLDFNYEHKRVKTYKVHYIEKWELKNGIAEYKITPTLLNNLDYQVCLLGDSIKVLLENIQHFKMKHLTNREVNNNKYIIKQ